MNQLANASLDTSDIVAMVLSFLLPGVGHFMLGQGKKGIVILAAVILSCGVGYIASLLVVLDAYLVARVRKERNVGEWEFFPEHHRMLGI